jgi:hypothetical protein
MFLCCLYSHCRIILNTLLHSLHSLYYVIIGLDGLISAKMNMAQVESFTYMRLDDIDIILHLLEYFLVYFLYVAKAEVGLLDHLALPVSTYFPYQPLNALTKFHRTWYVEFGRT